MVWFMLVAGLVLLIIGADVLVRGAARLAAAFGVPALVIGLTVVAFGTSAPELAVSVKSSFAGQAELAIANVVGSNIFNVLFILGLSALVAPLVVLMTLDGMIGRLEAVVLVTGLLLYTVFLFYQGRKNNAAEADAGSGAEPAAPLWQNLLLVVGGLALLVLGSRWLVDSAVSI